MGRAMKYSPFEIDKALQSMRIIADTREQDTAAFRRRFAACGLQVNNLTRDLHANGIVGIMTGYEEKFHGLGTPINRCEVVCKPFVLPKEEKKTEENAE